MKLWTVCALCAVAAVSQAAEPLNQLTAQEKKDGFLLLFNGKNLDGWDGDPALWSVKDGAIVGTTDNHPITENTFLVYKEKFADLVLRFDIKLRNHNSGVQFRSALLPHWVVTGYQADASEVEERSAWGNFYEEKGRGRNVMKTPDEGWRIAKPLVHHGDWNSYEVYAKGEQIRIRFNGVETIQLKDDKAKDGVVALQLHAGIPMHVEFRNLRIQRVK